MELDFNPVSLFIKKSLWFILILIFNFARFTNFFDHVNHLPEILYPTPVSENIVRKTWNALKESKITFFKFGLIFIFLGFHLLLFFFISLFFLFLIFLILFYSFVPGSSCPSLSVDTPPHPHPLLPEPLLPHPLPLHLLRPTKPLWHWSHGRRSLGPSWCVWAPRG